VKNHPEHLPTPRNPYVPKDGVPLEEEKEEDKGTKSESNQTNRHPEPSFRNSVNSWDLARATEKERSQRRNQERHPAHIPNGVVRRIPPEVSDAYRNFQIRMAEFEARYRPQEAEGSTSRKKRQYLPVDFNPEAERWMRQEFQKGYDKMQDLEKKKKWAEDFRMDLLKIKEEHRRNRVLAHQKQLQEKKMRVTRQTDPFTRQSSVRMV
jgi:hypothetical protein